MAARGSHLNEICKIPFLPQKLLLAESRRFSFAHHGWQARGCLSHYLDTFWISELQGKEGGESWKQAERVWPFMNSQISDLVSTACGRGPSLDTCACGHLSIPPTHHSTHGRHSGDTRQTLGNGVRQEGLPEGWRVGGSGSGEGRLWE